jgi:hypothetical protein
VDPFHFAIALPPDADSLTLLRELSRNVAQLAGLPGAAAQHAQDELEALVQERMRRAPAHTDVEVSFTRGPGDAAVRVEVASVSRAAGTRARGGDASADDGRQRLSWAAGGGS